MTSRRVLIALAAVLALAHCIWFAGFLVDDGAISFSYARSIAHGAGAVITPGGERVEGYTNFLWVMLLAAGIAVGGDPFFLAHLFGALLCIGVVLGTAALCRALRGRPDPLDGVAACVVALLPPVAYWSMSGLEGGLYTALVVGCVARLLIERDSVDSRPWSALLAAGCALTRPDGAAVVVLACVFALAFHRRKLVWLLLALGLVVAHEAWRYWYYAWPVPNTFYAKVSTKFRIAEAFDHRSEGWRYVLGFVERYRLWALVVPALLVLVPGVGFVRRAFVVIVLGGLVFFPIYARGDWMSEGRFLVAALPILCALAFVGIDRIPNAWVQRGVIGIASLVVLTIALQHSWERRGNYPVPASFVAKRGLHYKALAEKYGIPSPSALDGDLGGTSYYSGMPIVDLGMLADVTLARYRKDWSIEREYVFGERRPTFMRLAGFWLDDGLQSYPEFIDRYVPSGMADIWIDRSAFLADDVDPRTALLSGDADGIDVLGVRVGEKLEAWLLPRREGGVVPEVHSGVVVAEKRVGHALGVAEKAEVIRLEDPLYRAQRWRPGEVVHVIAPRPTEPIIAEVCVRERCVPITGGEKHGAALGKGAWPQPLPAASKADLDRALAAGELEQALAIAERLGADTKDLARKLLVRAATNESFHDYALALRADPSLSWARRKLEALRFSPREQYRYRFEARLDEALRAFRLAPDTDKLALVAVLARAAHRPHAATMAALTTGLAPPDGEGRAALADCLALDGLSDQPRHETKITGWDFEGNDLEGWTHEGAFGPGPTHFVLGMRARGFEGHGYLSADAQKGSATSPPLPDGIDEVCFVSGGSRAGAGVRIEDHTAFGQGDDLLRESCLPAAPGQHIVVFDEGGARVLADDFSCLAHGRPLACTKR